MGEARRREQDRIRKERLRREMGAPPWVIAPVNWAIILSGILWGGVVCVVMHIGHAKNEPYSEPRDHWLGRRWLWK
jgi:hypothetical protein